MSSAHDAPGSDSHDDHAFTGKPVDELPPDEPRTPGWLPVLGIALFTLAAVVFLAGRSASAPSTAERNTAAASVAPPAAPPAPSPIAVKPSPQQAGVVKKLVEAAH
jgi:hypothetical protein